jgi:Icc-related predicted phosphoesterase
MSVKICVISDTHMQHDSIVMPDADILIHSGDATYQGKPEEVHEFGLWLYKQLDRYKHIIFVAGNHDWLFQTRKPLALELIPKQVHYLEDSGVELMGLKFWGSPYQPRFFDWAFNLSRGKDLKEHWDLIPSDTDVLITHSPPYSILDESPYGNERAGCEDLLEALKRVQPKLHCFGHIHHSYGRQTTFLKSTGFATEFVNASICDEKYRPLNNPIVVEL